MNKIKKVLLKEEATNIITNEIIGISEDFKNLNIDKLNKISENTKKTLAALDDLSRTFLEIKDMRNFLMNNNKKERVFTSTRLKNNLMLKVLESQSSTKMFIEDINRLNGELKEETIANLITIKSNVDFLIESISSLSKKTTIEIEDRNFNPIEYVEDFLTSYINLGEKSYPQNNTAIDNNMKKKEIKENKKDEPEDMAKQELILALDKITEIFKKYNYNIKGYNFNSVKGEINKSNEKLRKFIAYISQIFNNLCLDGYAKDSELEDIKKHIIKAMEYSSNKVTRRQHHPLTFI